jgi:hypothetical protein
VPESRFPQKMLHSMYGSRQKVAVIGVPSCS